MQDGSLALVSRKEEPGIWRFRWSEKDLHGARGQRKRVIGTVERYLISCVCIEIQSPALTDASSLVAESTRPFNITHGLHTAEAVFLPVPWRIYPITTTRSHWSDPI
jgi:hypothetical protein